MVARPRPLLLLCIVYLGFVSLGLPDGALGVAWPQAHIELRAPVGLAGAIMIVLTLLSAVSGFASGRLIARFTTGPVALACAICTGCALIVIARAHSVAWLFAAAIPLGLGAGAADASLNGYVARHYSGRHMNWLHACWGIGATCGPLVMAEAVDQPAGWRAGYLALGVAQLSLALIFAASLRLWRAVPERSAWAAEGNQSDRAPTTAADSFAGWLSAGIFALYVAVEVTVGLWASSILVLSRGFSRETAGLCAAAYYGAITVGRIGAGAVVDRVGARRSVAIGIAAALGGTVLFALGGRAPASAAAALMLVGLGFAPIYPCLMHEVPRRFAPGAVQTVIGRQSGAAYIGGAFLPAVSGWVAQASLTAIPWVVMAGILSLAIAVRKLNRLT